MARFWVGGSGTWDNSSTTHWSTSSGGAPGASVPGIGDNVSFNASSGTGIVLIDITLAINNLDFTNSSIANFTWTNFDITNITGIIHLGNVTHNCPLSGFNYTSLNTLTFNADTSTINFLDGNTSFNVAAVSGLTFYNVNFTGITDVGGDNFIDFHGNNTFNILTIAPNVHVVFDCGLVITGNILNAIGAIFTVSTPSDPTCKYTLNFPNLSAQEISIADAIVLGATSPFTGFVILNGTDNGGNANLVFVSGSAYVTDAIKTLGTSITISGEVFQINTVTVSEHGFVYSSVNNPTVADTKVVDNGSSSYFQTTITPTPQNGIKFIRAYAITSVGTFYGNAINLLIHLLDSAIPKFFIPVDALHMTIPSTDSVLVDQGYTYNQAGFTYNQAGVDYGGVDDTAGQDIVPMLQFADPTTPHNISFGDIYTPFITPPKNSGMLIGILGLTYP